MTTKSTEQRKREFFRLVVKGWKEQKLKFAIHRYYNPNTGGYCALGVAAKAANPSLVLDGSWADHDKVKTVLLPYWNDVAQINSINVAMIQNECRTKGEAMTKIRKALEI